MLKPIKNWNSTLQVQAEIRATRWFMDAARGISATEKKPHRERLLQEHADLLEKRIQGLSEGVETLVWVDKPLSGAFPSPYTSQI